VGTLKQAPRDKYDIVIFKVLGYSHKGTELDLFIHTIRHRRNGRYYPYVVTLVNTPEQAYLEMYSDKSPLADANGIFNRSVYFPKVSYLKEDWGAPNLLVDTKSDMIMYILEREPQALLESMFDKAPLFQNWGTIHRRAREAFGILKQEGYYGGIRPEYYQNYITTAVLIAGNHDPWQSNRFKQMIIGDNVYPPLYRYSEPAYKSKMSAAKTAQGGTTEPMSNPSTTATIDLSVIKELKDAIKSIERKPTVLEERLLEAVIEKTKDLATAELELELKSRLQDFIQKTYGVLPQLLEIKVANGATKLTTGIFHEKLPDILTMLANNIPVMLTGPAGSGKNYSLEQAAQALEIPFYYTGAITQEYKLTGFIDAGGRYHETEFYKAFKNGGLFMLDEVDASSPETLVILNGAIANRYFDFPNGRIQAHENFRIACAGNTYGTGADMIYVGRNVLDGATLDRFAVIKMDYDLNIEKQLCPDQEFFDFVQAVRKTVFKTKLRHIVGMRASINGYRSLMAGMSKQFIIESILLKGLGIDDINVLMTNLEDGVKSTDWGRELGKYQSTMKKAVK